MQVSTDGAVKFIGKETFTSRDEKRTQYYVVQVLDDEGKILRLFCNEEHYNTFSLCSFGQEVSLAFSVYEGDRGLRVRLKDVVL